MLSACGSENLPRHLCCEKLALKSSRGGAKREELFQSFNWITRPGSRWGVNLLFQKLHLHLSVSKVASSAQGSAAILYINFIYFNLISSPGYQI